MRDNLHCNCHICKVERHLFISLSEPPGSPRFSTLISSSPLLAKFASVRQLLGDLHLRGNGDSAGALVSELLASLTRAGTAAPDCELIQSVLVLAFTPTIHRTYWEMRAWFRELEPEDIAQQTFAFFLQLTTSAPVGMLNSHIAFVLSQALHRNAVRWARREQAKLLERERLLEDHPKPTEPSEDADFELISLLRDFLDYSVRIGILSEFERDLLIKVKVDGFVAKEVLDRHTVLSPKAVHVRLQRIMKRLQDAAWQFPSSNGNSGKSLKPMEPDGTKYFSKRMSTFSLSTFPGGAAISVSRRQFSLDISPRRATAKVQQFSTPEQDSLPRFAIPPSAKWQPTLIYGATSRRLAAISSSGSVITLLRRRKSSESLPSNPDAGPARIIQKELARNEKIPPKQICLPMAPARVRHILLLADSRISGICSSARRLAVGERGERFDASVHDDHSSRPLSRLHCGRRFDLRFW